MDTDKAVRLDFLQQVIALRQIAQAYEAASVASKVGVFAFCVRDVDAVFQLETNRLAAREVKSKEDAIQRFICSINRLFDLQFRRLIRKLGNAADISVWTDRKGKGLRV